ncbi:MAG: Gfo/Idh/MocA family oxidoreductase [Burkholderiaceae bacterium]|nr:Gfo/Idh/MocA family oxidoreductase [Burkholderiaceae bacterium]
MARIRLGMVGGGKGAFIGAVHRMAARLDDRFELVAMAPSSDPQRARDSGAELGLASERVYADYHAMASVEKALDDGVEAVAIVTPNHLHYPVACAFMDAGIHVMCDKPLTRTLEEALDLQGRAQHSSVLFGVAYTYSGYPMVRQAREMVANGALGEIRLVQVEYAQGWLAEDIESGGQKQALWRTDPALAGKGGCIGDIGTHAFHLAGFVTGLRVTELSADLHTFVPGRRVDDNAQIGLRFENGARGHLWASQVATGSQNALSIRVFGTKGALRFCQEAPEELWYTPLGEPARRLTRGGSSLSSAASNATRIPGGHPEGYLEAFALLYRELADQIMAQREGQTLNVALPGLLDGVMGMRFVDAALRSHAQGAAWMPLVA